MGLFIWGKDMALSHLCVRPSSSSLLLLVTERGLRALLLLELGPDHALDKEELEALWTFILTSGTRSLPSAPGWSNERSRFCGEVEGKGFEDCGGEYKDTRDSDLRLKDWENLVIISVDSTGKEEAERISVAERDDDEAVKVDWTPRDR